MLKKDDPTQQVVYYQVASLGQIAFEASNPDVLSSGRDRNLHQQRCAQDGGLRRHLQIVGPHVCFQHREPHQRSFLAFHHARRD